MVTRTSTRSRARSTRPDPRGRVATVAVPVAAAGLALVAAATFLPWLRSGSVLRDSYQSISVIRTLDALDSTPLDLALATWTLIIPIITVCAAGYAMGLRRTSATISTILAIFCGTVAAAATVIGGGEDSQLGPAGAGPTTMLIGSVLTVIGVGGIFAGSRSTRGR